MNVCLIVPHYNHMRQFAGFLPQLEAQKLPCIVVDDGSDVEQVHALRALLNDKSDVQLLELPQNSGKGAAVFAGCELARTLGFTHALQIDADGQHDAGSVAALLEKSRQHPQAIISGLPSFDRSVPPIRYWGRKITLYLSRLESFSTQIEDAMCGFRVYPLQQLQDVASHFSVGKGMDFDAEILVKSVWHGVALRYVTTPVRYMENGVSHFHYLKDNVVMAAMHVRLLFGMLVRVPWLITRQSNTGVEHERRQIR